MLKKTDEILEKYGAKRSGVSFPNTQTKSDGILAKYGVSRSGSIAASADISTTPKMQYEEAREVAVKKPNLLGRVVNTVKGGLESTAGSLINNLGTLYEAGSGGRSAMYEDMADQYKKEYEQAQADLATMEQENREKPGTYSEAEMQGQQNILADAQRKYLATAQGGSETVQQGTVKAAQEIADTVSQKGQEDIAKAKEGLGTFGQMLVDAGASTAQVAGDVAVNALLGTGGSMLPFAARAFGGATQKARQEGGSLGEQLAYGAVGTAKELITEKMFNVAMPFAKAYGGGSFDDAVKSTISKAVEKVAKTEAGAKLLGSGLTLTASGITEGLEELVGDWIEWQMPRIYGGKVDSASETLANSLYDFAVGAISGTMGGVVDSNVYNYDTTDITPKLTREDGSYTGNDGQRRFAGVSEERQAEFLEAEKIAAKYGVKLYVEQLGQGTDGQYSGSVITINAATERPVRQVLIHELTHHMENSGQYEVFAHTVLEHLAQDKGVDVSGMKKAITEQYRQQGTELDDTGATRELVAKYAESALFQDEASIRRLAQTDRNLFQRIYDWLRDAVANVNGTSEEQFIRNAEKLYREVLASVEGTEKGSGGKQYLYAGQGARTANLDELERAMQMEDAGGDVQAIREQTGWMRGMDGKWRFEIDDSAMEYDRQTTNGAAGPSTLKDYIRHDALFAAYPELANAKMLFAELGARQGATYNPRTNIITINSDMRNAPESEIIHEVQHAIQGMEGFSSGASREYWERRMMKDGYSKRWNNSHQEMMPSELYRNTAGEIEARDAAARRRMTAEERALLLPAMADRNTVFVEGASAMEMFDSEEVPDHVGAVAVLRENLDNLRNMTPVAIVSGTEIPADGKATERAMAFVNSFGGKVLRPGFGEVLFSKGKIKNSLLGHGFGESKIELLAGVPDVIERGQEIGYTPNWKGRGYDSYIFAAPVRYRSETVFVTAIVVQDTANRYYLHEAVDQNGNVIFGQNKSPITASDGSAASPQSTVAGIELSKNSVARTSQESNGDFVEAKPDNVQKSQGPSFDELLAELREGQEDYLGALARDENAPSGTRITPADAANEAKWRRLQSEEAPPERTTAPISKRDLDELVQLYQDIASPVTTAREARFEESEGLVSAGTPKQHSTVQQKADEVRSYFLRKMVDAGDSVNRIGRAVKDKYLYPYYNMARGSASAAVNMIQNEQTDITGHTVGRSLNSIFDPIRAKGESYYNQFQIYLYDLHNIDRMSLVRADSTAKIEAEAALREFDRDTPGVAQLTEARLQRMAQSIDEEEATLAKERLRLLRAVNRADRMGNKPVFSYEFSADMSKERSDRLLQEHPEFAQYRQQVREYIKNLMQYRVDSGLMTAEDAAFLEKYYPNYVPTFRNTEKKPSRIDRKNAQVGRTVGWASGGNQKLVPLHEALGKQTMQTVREGSKNRFGLRLLDTYRTNSEGSRKYILDAQKYDADFDPETFDQGEELRKNNTFVVINGKEKYEMTVDDSLFDAVKALYPDTQESNTVVKAIRAGNNLFKSLATGYNPTFMLRNTVRDLQTAGLYSRDGFAFLKNYPRALNEIRTNGGYWKQYRALGGSFSSVFDYQTGTVKKAEGKAAKLVAKMEALNMAMEQAPRLAEFMSVAQAGNGSMDNLMDAMHAAADVTVNFGRAGTLGKVLNANFVPFLNPGIQGFDKLIRRVTETKGSREWAKLAVRAAVLGIAPTVLNGLLYSDDEDWKNLKDSDKDTNYLFKIGDGLWMKIPKGRELSILGMTADRIQDIVNGENVDWGDFITTVGNQVAPANPLRQNILAAWFDTDLFNESNPGRAWYGGDIESQRLQNYAPGERYDSSTDVFSRWLGRQLDLSPKKINYLLDQYSGVVGDFFLPLLTPQAERNMFAKAFTIDSVSSNRLSREFYDTADELTYAKNSGDTTAKILSRFWSKQQDACSAIYAQIRDIEESDDLSNKEKKEQVREAKVILNGIQKNALAVLDTYKDSVESHLTGDSDEEIESAYREANNECFGAEYALQIYNKDTYANAQQAAGNGVGYDEFYAYYFDTKGYAKKGSKSITTQKVEYLQQSEFSEDVKAEIYFADLASDSDLKKQAELETSHGITAVQYWQYKVATLGMTKKVEKLEAIDNLNLTQSQKTALYYANGYAESTLDDAPWIVGTDRWIGPDITPKLSVGKIDKPNLLG